MTPVARESLAPALAPFGQSSTLPSEAYTSESVFRWDLDHFFDRTWVCIGRTEDLQTPGDQRAVALGLESALLTRDEAGGLHAFYNVCRHRGHELVESDGFDPSYARDFWDITNRQDWRACEGVQRGVSSRGYRQGPLSPREDAVYQFITMVARGYLEGKAARPASRI